MRTILLSVTLLFLIACDSQGLSDKQQDEVGDIAGDVAYDVVAEHEKIKELEARIEEMEERIGI